MWTPPDTPPEPAPELLSGASGMRAPGGKSLSVARDIEQRILAEGLQPGEPLPAETAFARMLGVNRSTLREALRVLEQNGLVYREPGRRKLRVGQPNVEDVAPRLSSAIVAQQVTFEELFEAMTALEPAIANAAAKRASPGLIAALEDNLARTRRAIDDRESLTILDIEFHALVARGANNRAFEAAHLPLSSLFYPAFYQVMSRLNAAERLLVAHTRIVESIRAGDAEESANWMRRHVEDFQRGYILADLSMSTAVTHG